MTVFQNRHRGGQWRYDFRVNGLRYQGQCITPEGNLATSERQAREAEALAKARARAEHGKASRSISRPGTFTFGQALLDYIESQTGSSPVHVANLKLYGRELLGFFGADTPILEISQERVEEYRRFASSAKVKVWRGGPRARQRMPEKLGQGERVRSPASVNHYLKCLRAALGRAHRIKDPVTGMPMLPFPPTVEPVRVPKRRPKPMPDAELYARLDVAPPWAREAAELARLFGLRRAEALGLELRHIDHDAGAIRFDGSESKSKRDELAHPIPGGWELLRRLERQAVARGQVRLVTWPGPKHMAAFLRGEEVPRRAWRGLKSIRRSWRNSATKAEVAAPHRLHDVRARYVTEVAKVASAATAQEAARHADPATTARYVALAEAEVAKALKAVPRAGKPPARASRKRAGG